MSGQVTAKRPLTLALAGNPNCGKTTVFNGLTGQRQVVGNWPGVTVERKEGTFRNDGSLTLVDLPGIYGLSALSEDERVSRDYLLQGSPDGIINLVDATNIERNLYLTIQLIETGLPVLVVLTMKDLAEKKGLRIDLAGLEAELGVPVVAVNALAGADYGVIRSGVARLVQGMGGEGAAVAGGTGRAGTVGDGAGAGLRMDYGPMEGFVATWAGRLVLPVGSGLGARGLAVRLLEGEDDSPALAGVTVAAGLDWRLDRDALSTTIGEDVDVLVADIRYTFIASVVAKWVTKPAPKKSFTERLDRVVLNRIAGIPIFLGAMFLVFWVTIGVGGAFIDFFDIAFGTVFVDGFGALLAGLGSPEWLVTLLAGGVGAGIQTVSTFVPIIFFMFLMLTLLEESGYMARAAFVMDRLMRRIGLPGKSFVPMLLGLGCTIPAVLATRTLETKRDRFTTIFMAPLMSCGARLPVYALFAAAIFKASGGAVVFSIYLVGLVISIITGLLVKKTLFPGAVSHFVMELPAYRLPRVGRVLGTAGRRLMGFVQRATVTITAVVVVLAFLNSLGFSEQGPSFGNEDSDTSVLATIGKTITPVFEPMGVKSTNWPATVGLFTGLFAKEAVVGTVNSLYSGIDAATAASAQAAEDAGPGLDGAGGGGADLATEAVLDAAAGGAEAADMDAAAEGFDLGAGLLEALGTIPANLAGVGDALLDPLGLGVVSGDEEATAEELETEPSTFALMRDQFTFHGAYAYLLFILIYFPCVAALGASVQELGKTLGWFQAAYLTILAWSVSTLYFQVAEGHQWGWSLLAAGLLAGIWLTFRAVGRSAPFKRMMQ